MTTVVEIKDYIEKLPGVLSWEFVGSRVTVTPPPMDTDQDVLVLTTDDVLVQEKRDEMLMVEGWDLTFGYQEETLLDVTARRDDVNLLFVSDMAYYTNFILARDVCHALNVQDKAQRGLVHRIICREV
jgi:hypothetical protein